MLAKVDEQWKIKKSDQVQDPIFVIFNPMSYRFDSFFRDSILLDCSDRPRARGRAGAAGAPTRKLKKVGRIPKQGSA